MKNKVNVADIKLGVIADRDYFSDKGELLIGKGTLVLREHLDTFRRRNIFEIHTGSASRDDDRELLTLLNRDFTHLSGLDSDIFSGDDSAIPLETARDAPLDITDLSEVKTGKDGLEQLMRSRISHSLDTLLNEGKTPDQPSGPALKESAGLMSPADRSERYKAGILQHYGEALELTRAVMLGLADGNPEGGRAVRGLVEQFVKLYTADRDILFNISCTKNSDYEYLFHHSLNVCLLAINIAASAGYSERQVVDIGIGALLHDIGMLLVPPHIRCKDGRLSDHEWFEVQKHPILGLHLIEKIAGLPLSAQFIAYQVHERDNGNGYPKQRKGRLINRHARIVQIADIYEAMSSPRSYRKPWLPHEATSSLLKMTKVGLLAGDLVKAFLEYASLFPVGSLVELSDRSIGRVVHANADSFTKPVVSVVMQADGKPLTNGAIYQVDLSRDPYLRVVRAFGSDRLKNCPMMEGF